MSVCIYSIYMYLSCFILFLIYFVVLSFYQWDELRCCSTTFSAEKTLSWETSGTTKLQFHPERVSVKRDLANFHQFWAVLRVLNKLWKTKCVAYFHSSAWEHRMWWSREREKDCRDVFHVCGFHPKVQWASIVEDIAKPWINDLFQCADTMQNECKWAIVGGIFGGCRQKAHPGDS